MNSFEHPDEGGELSPVPVGGGNISVERVLIGALAAHYTEYHHALARPFDPVRILNLTGSVLRCVKDILTACGHVPAQCEKKGR